MIIAIWLLTAVGIACWSLAAWGVLHLLTLDPSAVRALEPWIQRAPYPDLLERWIPNWQDWLRFGIDLLQLGLSWVGSAAPVVVWAVWGLGIAAALLTAGLLTLLVRLLRSEFGSGAGPRARAGA